MGSIFADASLVLVWLGPSEEGLDHCDQLFQELRAASTSHLVVQNPFDHQQLEKLLLRPWFQRRWTIQEVIVAREAIVMCGSHTIDFMSFTSGVWKHMQARRLDTPLPEIVRKLCTMYRFRQSLFWRSRSAILGLLVAFHAAECSDDRDRIHALDGLTDWKIAVSYVDPVEVVYLRYATAHIDFGNTALLNCSGAFRSTTRNYPTWAPDWRSKPTFVPVTTSLSPVENLHSAGTVQCSGSRNILQIKGRVLEQVATVGLKAPFPMKEAEMLNLLLDWCALFCSSETKAGFISTITLGSVEQREQQESTSSGTVIHHLEEVSRNMADDARQVKDKLKLSSFLRDLFFSKLMWTEFDLDLYSSVLGGLGRAEAGDRYVKGTLDQSPKDFVNLLCHTTGGRTCFVT